MPPFSFIFIDSRQLKSRHHAFHAIFATPLSHYYRSFAELIFSPYAAAIEGCRHAVASRRRLSTLATIASPHMPLPAITPWLIFA